MSVNQTMAASKIERYRVNRGELRGNAEGTAPFSYQKNFSPLVTIKDVEEVRSRLKKQSAADPPPPSPPALALAPPSPPAPVSPPSSLSLLPPPSISKRDRIAHLRFGLIVALQREMLENKGGKRVCYKKFLKKYNSGQLLPEIFKELGSISLRTLYRLLEDFNSGGIEALTPQYGGAGTSKITDHEKNYLLTILLRPNRIKKSYAITLTKEMLKLKGIESPSGERTLRRYIDQLGKEHFDLWVLAREGEKAFNDKILPYAERDWQLLEVGEGLVADGHRLNFQVIHPITGKPCRAVLVLFWDWKSSYPLGWEIMIEENVQCIASALRNSILTLGKIPKWLYLDNGKAFKAKTFTEDLSFEDTELPGMFARLKIKFHFAQAYNAQSKPIERIFGILNEQLERLVPSYTGASIEDKPAWTKRNERLAKSVHDPWVPTILEANELICGWRDRYAERPSRGRNGLRPIDIFNEGKGPGVDPLELTYLMMDRDVTDIHRNGITWIGWHWFDEALVGLRDRVVIRYSLSDLSQIYVFYKNEFLCTARPVEKVHPMASESENPKDMEAVKDVIRLKKRVKNTTQKLLGLLETKTAAQIDWDRTRSGGIVETIQAIEEKQRPETIPISPWLEDETGMAPVPPEEPKERPKYKPPKDWSDFRGDAWERYDYHMAQYPKELTQENLEFVEWYRCTPEYRAIYGVKPGPTLSTPSEDGDAGQIR